MRLNICLAQRSYSVTKAQPVLSVTGWHPEVNRVQRLKKPDCLCKPGSL